MFSFVVIIILNSKCLLWQCTVLPHANKANWIELNWIEFRVKFCQQITRAKKWITSVSAGLKTWRLSIFLQWSSALCWSQWTGSVHTYRTNTFKNMYLFFFKKCCSANTPHLTSVMCDLCQTFGLNWKLRERERERERERPRSSNFGKMRPPVGIQM